MEENIICGPDLPLKIDKDKELGRGGHALMLRGEILYDNMVGILTYVVATTAICIYCYSLHSTAKTGCSENNQ